LPELHGADLARSLARTVRTDSPAALRRVVADLAALGTDELLLVPTTADPTSYRTSPTHRIADRRPSGHHRRREGMA
jgi:hypothetical protein